MSDIVPVSADLYMRASASPSAIETNITSAHHRRGACWDVKDVDTSADGTQGDIRHARAADPKQQVTKPPSWRILQYVIATDTLHPVINPAIDPDPLTVQDESPHYLPDGRIVFSSTRQTRVAGRAAQ